MKRIILFILNVWTISGFLWSQNPQTIIDSVNLNIAKDCLSFSYEVKVESIEGSIVSVLDEGHVIVNNTTGKYDDFLFISSHKRDTFCYVTDTLIRNIKDELFKDSDPDVLHRRLGTSKMFFRCFSSSFKNETTLINADRWDKIMLDSINESSYYLSLYGTLTALDIFHTITIQVIIDRSTFQIRQYMHQIESEKSDKTCNLFTFNNWSFSEASNQEVYDIFEKRRKRSNSPEYLSVYPTRKMKLDRTKTLSLAELSIADSLDNLYTLKDMNERYIVLYFWFKGCYHCRHVAPVIQKFHYKNLRSDIVYLGVDTVSKDKETFKSAIKSYQYDFPNYRLMGGVDSFTVNVAPFVIIYDNRENKVLQQLAGGEEDYENRFLNILEVIPVD